jgi:hypothetical protein
MANVTLITDAKISLFLLKKGEKHPFLKKQFKIYPILRINDVNTLFMEG